MKKSEEIRRKTWRMIAKNLIVLVALAVAAFIGVRSWFVQNTTAIADGIYAKTKVNDKLEFYIMPPSDSDQYNAINQRFVDNQAWNDANPTETKKQTEWHRGELTFDFSDQEFKFMDGLFMSEVTGDGSSFKIPKLIQYGQIAYVDTSQDFDNAVANDNYMSFDLYFRSKNAYSIALLHNSSIEPVNGSSLNGQHDYTGDANEASMKPAAIGAVRMSVLNCESSNTRELLWIPAPNVWYDGINDHLYTGLSASGSGNYSFSEKGSVYIDGTQMALTNEGTTAHAFYSANNEQRSVWTVNDSPTHNVRASTAGDYQLGSFSNDDITVLTLQNEDSNGYYYGRIRINLWIEGEDAEARLRFVSGKFNMSLNFDIIESVSSGS